MTPAESSSVRRRQAGRHPWNTLLASRTATFKRRHRWLLGALFSTSLRFLGADGYTLQVRVQPGRALGGEAFLEQPQVEISEGDGGDIDALFEVK